MSKPLPPPPEPKPAFLRFTAREVSLFLSSPAFVLVVLALAAAPGLVSVLVPQRTAPPSAPNVAVQEWTTDATPLRFATVVLGALPPPDPRQRKAPCDPDLEREVSGYCWVALKVPPPCPRGKAWEHEGVCYGYALKAAGVPTSGDVQRASVAGP